MPTVSFYLFRTHHVFSAQEDLPIQQQNVRRETIPEDQNHHLIVAFFQQEEIPQKLSATKDHFSSQTQNWRNLKIRCRSKLRFA